VRQREIEARPAGVERREVLDGEGDVRAERVGTRLARAICAGERSMPKKRASGIISARDQRCRLAAAELDHPRELTGHRQAVQPGEAREPVRMHRGNAPPS